MQQARQRCLSMDFQQKYAKIIVDLDDMNRVSIFAIWDCSVFILLPLSFLPLLCPSTPSLLSPISCLFLTLPPPPTVHPILSLPALSLPSLLLFLPSFVLPLPPSLFSLFSPLPPPFSIPSLFLSPLPPPPSSPSLPPSLPPPSLPQGTKHQTGSYQGTLRCAGLQCGARTKHWCPRKCKEDYWEQ